MVLREAVEVRGRGGEEGTGGGAVYSRPNSTQTQPADLVGSGQLQFSELTGLTVLASTCASFHPRIQQHNTTHTRAHTDTHTNLHTIIPHDRRWTWTN